MVLAAM